MVSTKIIRSLANYEVRTGGSISWAIKVIVTLKRVGLSTELLDTSFRVFSGLDSVLSILV